MQGLSWCNPQTLQGTTWDDVERRVSPPVRAAIEKVMTALDGGGLSREECLKLANSEGDDLFGLVVAANQLRQRLVGDTVTYVITRNINFTNVCFVGCKFCAFSVGPRDETAYFLSLDEVAHKCREAEEWGATEVCIQGGLPRNLPPLYYRDILRAVKSATPKMHAHAFSPMEMMYGVELTGMPVREYLLMLKDNGLDTLPGTAAEILDDSVRQVLSRNKLTSAQWREVIETAHECGIRSTSTMMYGHSEMPEHWVNQMLLFREIQSRTGGFTEFVPLGFIHENTLLFAQGLARDGGTMAEHMKVHALARLVLAGSINHIQVSWVKLGREASQLSLLAGADDYGGTLFEENISRLAGSTAGQYTSAAEFQERIVELGRIPAQRNTLYTQYIDNIPPASSLARRLKAGRFSTPFDTAEAGHLQSAVRPGGNA
jgi:7,8-didemethyl-8-hydroxy-5-deazariboflavin synthase CofH subunit